MDVNIEFLAAELHSLVNYGVTNPDRLLERPILRGLVETKYPEAFGRTLALAIRSELKDAAAALEPNEAEASRALLKLDSRFERWWVTKRRDYAMAKLKDIQPVQTWRRDPELRFMGKLARSLVESVMPERQKYRIVQETITYKLDRVGALTERTVFSRIEITAEDFPIHWEVFQEYAVDRRPGVLKPEAIEGCEVISWREPFPDRSLVAIRLKFPKLLPGQEHVWAYRLEATTSVPATYFLMLTRGPIVERRMSVIFNPARLPRQCWYFKDIPGDLFVPGVPRPEQEVEGIGTTYSHNFIEPELGTWHGLAWRW